MEKDWGRAQKGMYERKGAGGMGAARVRAGNWEGAGRGGMRGDGRRGEEQVRVGS